MNRAVIQSALFHALLPDPERGELNGAVWQESGFDCHGSMMTNLFTFLRYRRSSQRSQAEDHARNDALLFMLIEASRLNLDRSRVMNTSSTLDQARSYTNIAMIHYPPYLVVEERPQSVNLSTGRYNIAKHFRWMKDYDPLPFVFAIVIAGNMIEFGYLDRDSRYEPFLTTNGERALFPTYESASIGGALHCVHAVINIGRYIRFLHHRCPPAASLGMSKLNTPIERPGDKTLRINCTNI